MDKVSLTDNKRKINKNQLFSAVAIIVGTVIGAGIFGLPYTASRSGFFVCLAYIIGLTLVTILVNLCYGETILRTQESHQVPGYAYKYLGRWGKAIVSFSMMTGIYGGLVAYAIGIGAFLHVIFGNIIGIPAFAYSVGFFIIASIIVLIGLKMIVSLEKFMVAFLLLVIIIFLFAGLPKIDIANLTTFNGELFFLPFGVVMFALAGNMAQSDARLVLRGQEKKFRSAIILGVLIPAVVYVVFTLAVVGVAGANTSQDAIEGLSSYLGTGVVLLGAILGTIGMSTSFFSLGLFLKESYIFDYHINKYLAWLLVVAPPFVVLIFSLASFIEILSVTGSIIGGLSSIIVIMMYYKAKKAGNRRPEFSLNVPKPVAYFLYLVFVLGIIYTIAELFWITP